MGRKKKDPHTLEELLLPVLNRLTFFPDRNLLSQFPLGKRILDLSEKSGGLEATYKRLEAENFFQSDVVPIPSLEQRLAGTLIAKAGREGKSRFEFSKPGTRKTIGVISAITVINEVIIPRLGYDHGTKVQTLVACPSYIIPTWIREAERLLRDPNIVVVTADNREYALKRAEREDVDLVLLGYSLSFRNSGISRVIANPTSSRKRFIELMYSVFEREKAVAMLADSLGEERARKYAARTPRLNDLLRKVVEEEEKSCSTAVAEFLQERVFIPEEQGGRPSYIILDEIHNVLSPTSKTAMSIAEIFRSARFGALVSGTGLRKEVDDLAFNSYLTRRINDPRDFGQIVRGNPRVIRAMLELDANQIRTLKEVDPEVPDPILNDHFYALDTDEVDLWMSLTQSGLFDGKELYLLGTYLHTLPSKLLPENLNGNGKNTKKSDSESLYERVEKFFDDNPKLQEIARTKTPSKMRELEQIVSKAKERGEKAIVVCKYSSQLTEYLEDKLKEFGVVRIDNSSKSDPTEIGLSDSEIQILEQAGKLESQQKYRSHLSREQRNLLGISGDRIYNPSDRGLRLLEFQTNPNVSVCVTTYGVLREGVDAQEASVIVEYGLSTEPHQTEQLRARALRSGQRDIVKIHRLVGVISEIDGEKQGLEVAKIELHDFREIKIHQALFGDNPTVEELRELFKHTSDSNTTKIKRAMAESPKSILAMMFGSCVEKGVEHFYNVMQSYENALFLARNYNHVWDQSTSANCARLETAIISGLEELRERPISEILSLASGPASLSRMSNRRSTCVDINGFQLAFGEEATDCMGIDNEYLLGSFTNLSQLVNLSSVKGNDPSSMVFDPNARVLSPVGIEDESMDLVELTFALYYTLPEERKEVIAEVNRTLKLGGYFMLVNPTSRFDSTCHPNFYADLAEYGFEIDLQLSGQYTSQNIILSDEDSKASFQVHCLIARKTSNIEPERLNLSNYFAMQPQYKTVEVGPGRSKKKTQSSDKPFTGFICDGFVNVTTGVRLEDGIVQGVNEPSWYKGITGAIDSLPADDYDGLLSQLRELGKELKRGEIND